MGRRALLIGIPEYDEKQLHPLPAVRKDVSELERVLQLSGYDVKTLGTGDKNETTRGRLKRAITDFFESAGTGDTLLLYFSCHGCRLEDGYDYIIPADASLGGQDLADFLLPLECARYVDSSRADAVLVVADACRDGLEIHPGKVTKGPTVLRFGSAKREQVSRGGLAYYLGCGPADFCQCYGEEFSLFSRALATVMAPEHPARTLDEIAKATEILCEELAKQHKLSRQSTWLQTASPVSAGIHSRVFCEGDTGQATEIAMPDPWASLVLVSRLWQGLDAGEGTEKARLFAGRIASSCRKLWLSGRKDLARDPWPDDRLPLRVVGRLELLMGSLPDFKPSTTEVCVLLTAPFLYQAVIGATLTRAAREAAVFELEPQSEKAPLRVSLEKAHQSFPALVRQIRRLREIGRDAAADAVAAWMFHLCLRRRPETFLPADRGGALPATFVEELRQDAANTGRLLGDAFGDNDLFDLIHCLAAEVEYPGRRLEGERRIGVDAERQPLRREALGTLLMMASELALDPTSLDGVLLSHLGTGDPLEPAEILETLDRAQWNSRGSARLSLDVTCRHPAVDQALRLQVDELSKRGAWLQRILESEERNALKPLRGLRWLFDVDDLKPEKDEHGQPRYTTPHLRFHLAQDEVRELLLGEQIYDDPSLAIREMYQNALDACRYRQAREEYLKRKGLNRHLPPWEGKIVFRQWKEADGREILECEDNGVGMGRRELETCFARAGRRFADTPEYLEEEAEWHQLDPPIRLYPNSQFGIGVFSYFLLADEIEVFTRRFEKDGRPGKVLHVQLSGSGSLFRIRELEDCGQLCGCRIRLTLTKKGTSCLGRLRELLWRAEFSTQVCGEDGEEHWHASALKPPGDFGAILRETQHPDVFWLLESDGSMYLKSVVLADGVLVSPPSDEDSFFLGTLVDLKGINRPILTLDRNALVNEDAMKQWTHGVLTECGPAISTQRGFNTLWLWELASHHPYVAISIAEDLMDNQRELPLSGRSRVYVPLATTGFLATDHSLVEGARNSAIDYPSRTLSITRIPEGWRRPHLSAWRRSGLPLPQVFEQWLDLDGPLEWQVPDPAVSVWVEKNLREGVSLSVIDLLLGAEWTDLPIFDFVARLPTPWAERALRFLEQIEQTTLIDRQSIPELDLIALSVDLDGQAPWLGGGVPLGHVWNIAESFGVSTEEAMSILVDWVPVLALELPDHGVVDEPQGFEKEIFREVRFSTYLNQSKYLWKCHSSVTLPMLWSLAKQHQMDANELLACFNKWQATFRLSLPSAELVAAFPEGPQGNDKLVLMDHNQRWLDATSLTPRHVWRMARELAETPREILERIYRWEKPFGLIRLEMSEDLQEPAGRNFYLLNKLEQISALKRGPVDPFAILWAAEQLREPVSEILSRLGPYINPFGLEIPEELYRMP